MNGKQERKIPISVLTDFSIRIVYSGWWGGGAVDGGFGGV